jgi:hypothetical protein
MNLKFEYVVATADFLLYSGEIQYLERCRDIQTKATEKLGWQKYGFNWER